jgi:hypothetical protein
MLEATDAEEKCYSWLWDYSLVYEGELLTRMSGGDDGRSGYEQVTGETLDISKWLDFEFYDLVWWWDRPNKPNINDETKRLGRWLGISHRVGSDLCYWIVTDSGQVVSKTTPKEEEYDDMIVEECPKADDEEVVDKYLNMELRMGARMDDER